MKKSLPTVVRFATDHLLTKAECTHGARQSTLSVTRMERVKHAPVDNNDKINKITQTTTTLNLQLH